MARRGERLLDMLQGYYPGYHPIISLTDIAQDVATPVSLRYLCHKTILRYIEPEVKAVEYAEEKRIDNYVSVKLFGSNLDEGNDILEDNSGSGMEFQRLIEMKDTETAGASVCSELLNDEDMYAAFEAELAGEVTDG
jgi:hypothetical protein